MCSVYSVIDEYISYYVKMIEDIMNKNISNDAKIEYVNAVRSDMASTITEKIRELVYEREREIKSQLKDNEYTFSIDDYSIAYSSIYNEFVVFVNASYVTKFFEISEYCASSLEQYNDDKELSEEDYEKMYEECYENELDEINSSYAYNVEFKYNSKNYKIEIYPIYCDGDYCKVGMQIDIMVKGFNDIRDAVRFIDKELPDLLKQLIDFVIIYNE